MKTILKLMMLTLSVLLLAVAGGSAQVLSPVYVFNETNELNPTAVGLLLSSNTLYGTILGSVHNGAPKAVGVSASGAVFKLNTDGTGFTNLYAFSPVAQNSLTNTDGANSAAQLVLSDNRLYGTTEYGGFYAHGTVFAVNTDGTGFTNLYNFTAFPTYPIYTYTNSDGVNPSSGLVLSSSTLYGTTSAGGSFGGGTVFAINTDGTGFKNLYNFSMVSGSRNNTNSDGFGAKSSLILANNTLYGTVSRGGSAGNGTVFALNTDGTGFTNLHSFSDLVRMTTPPMFTPIAME